MTRRTSSAIARAGPDRRIKPAWLTLSDNGDGTATLRGNVEIRQGTLLIQADVARVERGTTEDRLFFRGNGVPMVGIGITKQSTANTLAVAKAAKAEMQRLNRDLPAGMAIKQSYDSSVFIEGAIREVYKTLFIAIAMVMNYYQLSSAPVTNAVVTTVLLAVILNELASPYLARAVLRRAGEIERWPA